VHEQRRSYGLHVSLTTGKEIQTIETKIQRRGCGVGFGRSTNTWLCMVVPCVPIKLT